MKVPQIGKLDLNLSSSYVKGAFALQAAVKVNARFNWWGTTSTDEIEDLIGGTLPDYKPILDGLVAAVTSGTKVDTNKSSLDAKTAAGVKVSGVVEDVGADVAALISAAKYVANPEDALDDAIAFYDVYVALQSGFLTDDVTIKLRFYDAAINTGSTVYFWTGDFWSEATTQEARAGLVWINVTDDTSPAIDELKATPFAVVAGEAVEDLMAAPVIAAPESGVEDVSLTPTFAWSAVSDADGYEFELSDNANFVLPLASMTGDQARLLTPFYQQVAKLDYSTYYYWRVKAISGSYTPTFSRGIETGGYFDVESGWSGGVFMTVAEVIPEPEVPPVWMCSEGLTFDSREALEVHLATAEAHKPVEPPEIVIEAPDVIVPIPAETPITPAWIYAIITVGAVLVIAVIVLIVRTRRVA